MPDNESLTEKFQSHLIYLIRLLYALAIVTGVSRALERYLESYYRYDRTIALALILCTFLIGIADFIIFHLLITASPYRSAFRLILDIIFPSVIFILFYLANGHKYYAILLLGYFLLTICYLLILRRDDYELPNWYWVGIGFSTLLAFTTYLGIWFVNDSKYDKGFWVIGSFTGLIYIIFNLLLANKQLHEEDPIRAL